MPFLLTRFGVILGLFFLLPFLVLTGLGGYWLWQQGWLSQGIGVISANTLLFYSLLRWRSHKEKPLFVKSLEITPNPNWADDAQQAWLELERFSKNYPVKTDLLTDPNKALKLTNQVLLLVARHFNADSKYPILEFPLPYLIKLIALVCEDLQQDVLNKIPGSHTVRVGDLVRTKDLLNNINQLKSIFTVGNWLFNWSGAALGKARSLLLYKGLDKVREEIVQRLVSAYISKLGYYAIQLYSGQLTLDDIVPTDILTGDSKIDVVKNRAHELSIEPLRILVLGQVSSGKSSLINALFGETKTAEGVLPTTSEITPFILERDGLQQAIVLDSAGYGGLEHEHAPTELKKEWTKVDVILIVCNASQAARSEDAKQLHSIRHEFQTQRKNRTLPVIIAVATQIDRLRPFREWLPPYDIQHPQSLKAQSIRDACEVIAHDLSLPIDRIMPVCLAPEKPTYNIDDGLIPLIHELLNDAQRVRYLRCLRNHQEKSYWQQWRKQATVAGQFIMKIS